MRGLWRIIGTPLAAAAALLPAAAQAGDDEAEPGWRYAFGHGLRHAGAGLTLGGYVTGEVQRLNGLPTQARISHTSVFLWWEPSPVLKLLAEVDQENLVARDRTERPARAPRASPERRVSLERLHLNWTPSDALSLRAGKFLTPVGAWNLNHADPLTWTANRPLLTQQVYPTNLTGLMASGQLAGGGPSLDWSLYASNGGEWAADPRQDLFTRVRGGRLAGSPVEGLQLGLSFARYEQQGSRGEQRSLEGLDLRWRVQGWELAAEWLRTAVERAPPLRPRPGPPLPPQPVRAAAIALPTEGGYVQGVAPLAPSWFAVARFERLSDDSAAPALQQTTVGLVWRPLPAAVVKLEHQSTRGRAGLPREGWTAAVSVLF